MATPSYKGNGQPQTDSGFLSGFGGWFNGTPTYTGEGQPSSGSSGFLSSGTPAYKSAPSANQAGSRIAIVVPRDLFPCDVTDPQQ